MNIRFRLRKKPIQSEKTHFEALGYLFQNMGRIASSLVGFTIFAYVIGWLQARSYYDTFGAIWLVDELSTTTILGFSWFSLSYIAWIFYLGFTDLVENKNRYKETFFILKYGWWPMILIYIVQFVFDKYGFQVVSIVLSSILVFIYIVFAGAAFEALILRIKDKHFKWEIRSTYLVFGILFFGFYLVPTKMGYNDALRDLKLDTTTLPKVVLEKTKSIELRLLYHKDNKYYLVELPKKDKYPKIIVASSDKIVSIQKYNQ